MRSCPPGKHGQEQNKNHLKKRDRSVLLEVLIHLQGQRADLGVGILKGYPLDDAAARQRERKETEMC